MTRRKGYGDLVGRAVIVFTGVCVLSMPAAGQIREDAPDYSRIAGNFDEVKVLPNGGPVPRTDEGHPDLTGRYYPNHAGRMIQGGYRLSPLITRQFDPEKTPQPEASFRPETRDKYQYPTPYGTCAPGGTPTSITTQATEHGPMELVQKDGVLWILTEFPQTIRRVPLDGRPHSEDPIVSFNGESVGRWEGDTLVVDTIAIDERMRNISVGRRGDAAAWTHSPEERVIERFTRVSENYLTYQVTVIDPVVLTEPLVTVPHVWTLAHDPNDVWTEYLCTLNEDPFHYENLAPEFRQQYEQQGAP